MFGFFKRDRARPPQKKSATAATAILPSARLMPEANFVVTFDDQLIRCHRPDGNEESVRWDDLRFVIIETNDTGPIGTDVWWILAGGDGKSGCIVPQGATGEQEMLHALQRLNGFDNNALIEAMTCVENQRFLCWKRQA
jgi:hypothetical protein